MLARIEPFCHWHTPIAWTGYILLRRRASSGSAAARRGCATIPRSSSSSRARRCRCGSSSSCTTSTSIHNWYYVGLPDDLLLRYFGYAWSFATIWPAIFETGELISSLRDRRAPANRADEPLRRIRSGRAAGSCVAAGAAHARRPDPARAPAPPYLAAPVWLGFILLLDPLNARAGAESILGDWRDGRTGAAGQPARGRAGLRAALGVLELLGRHQVDLHRADPART